VHYTPKHGSWLNQAEIEISPFARQCLGSRISSLAQLKREALAWTRQVNRDKTVIDWQFTRQAARIGTRSRGRSTRDSQGLRP